jgi:hypothetical protein
MRRNPNAQGPGPQRKRRDKLSRTTLFDDGSGGQTRRHDLASARLLVTKSRPIGFEDVVRPIAKSNGPPKSSRSSVPAERLVTRLNERAKGCAAILPMDGCHYDGCVLFERVLHARKGAPEAFHVLGLLHMLAHSSRSSPEPEGRLRVDLTRSPRRRRMAGICAQRTAGVDVAGHSGSRRSTSQWGKQNAQSSDRTRSLSTLAPRVRRPAPSSPIRRE